MSHILAFTDLDDTLFQTLPKCGGEQGLTPAAYGRDGRPISFMRPGQRALWDSLLKDAMVVPVTARDAESLALVGLPFRHGAVINFGGEIIDPSGKSDPDWLSLIGPKALEAAGLLAEAQGLAEGLIARGGLKARAILVQGGGLPFYLLVKTKRGHLHELSDIKDALEPRLRPGGPGGPGPSIQLKDNNLSILPAYLGKAPAVAFFMERRLPFDRGEALVLGLGDGVADLGFMGLCDYQVIPSRSQVAGLLSSFAAKDGP